MGSIRPIFTITVLVIVGAYLYVKINEGPSHSHASAHDGGNQMSEGVPPLSAAGGVTLARDNAAPAWPPLQPAAAPAAANHADNSKNTVPEVPPIPELPQLPSTADLTTPPPQTLANSSAELPKDLPLAQNADGAGPKMNLGGANAAAGSFPPLSPTLAGPATAPIGAINVLGQPGSVPPLPALAPSTNPTSTTLGNPAGALNGAQPPLPPINSPTPSPVSPPAMDQNPLRPSATTPPADTTPDRYGPVVTPPAAQPPIGPPTASQPPAPATATFAASWPLVQAALNRGDLKQAHQMLSRWHGDPSLTPAEAQTVDNLLSQLAGTVIYSTEHQLEPARVVKIGESLQSIAREYNVPWQLLAKINGVSASDQLHPGQTLKVLRGPFEAVVDLRRNELVLNVDGRYAGKFPVMVPAGAPMADGQWLVDQKLDGTKNAVAPMAYGAPAATGRTIILRNASNPGLLAGGPTLSIASSTTPAAPGAPPSIQVAPQDANEIADILSIGSRVTVRR